MKNNLEVYIHDIEPFCLFDPDLGLTKENLSWMTTSAHKSR